LHVGLVLSHQKPQGFILVGGAETFLFAREVVLGVETAIAAAPTQSEFLRHNFHGYEARSIGSAAVSERRESSVLLLAAFCQRNQTAGRTAGNSRKTNCNRCVSSRFRKTKDEVGSLGRFTP
jgi:hypothetical protein